MSDKLVAATGCTGRRTRNAERCMFLSFPTSVRYLMHSDCCYIKFGAARSGAALEGLFDACETLASAKMLSRLIAGVNAGRERAYRQMIAHGFRSDFQGVAMQRHNDAGYNRPSTYIVDDWR